MSEVFHGGMLSVAFDGSGGDFIFNDPGNLDVVTITKFAREGNTWPAPEAVTDGLANDQQGPTGERVPFAFNALNMDPTEVDTLRTYAFTLAKRDVQFTSLDGKTVMVLTDAVVRVQTAPINEFGKYGFVRIEGEATAAGSDRAYSVVYTP